jgi:hypothetical protein
MINALPGRPIRNNVSRTLERFHTYLLVVLGVAFIGTGMTAIGVVTTSPAAVAVGAGALVGAGLIAIFFALVGSRLTLEERSLQTDATSIASPTSDPEPENQRPVRPPRTSR